MCEKLTINMECRGIKTTREVELEEDAEANIFTFNEGYISELLYAQAKHILNLARGNGKCLRAKRK